MSFLLWQRDAPTAIGSRRRVFRAEEVPLLADARELCDRMNREQAGAAGQIAAAVAAGREEGRAAGYAAGRAAGEESLAAALTALAAELDQERARLRDEVAALALGVVRKLLGSLDQDEVLARLAGVAAGELLPGVSPRLVVRAERAAPVRERLAQLAPEHQFEVIGDPDLAGDACRIETDHGSVDAALEAQLERIAALWGVRR